MTHAGRRSYLLYRSVGLAPTMRLRAKDLMDPTVLTVDVQNDVLSCVRLMVDHGQGYAVIAGGDHPISGIVTEHDILEKVVAAEQDPSKIQIGSIASHPVLTCPPDLPMDDVAEMMAHHRVRRIVVADGDHVIGIITARSVLAMFRRFVDEIAAEASKTAASPSGSDAN